MRNVKILCVFGTRPEAIKMAPVVLALKRAPWADVTVLATAQHRQMLDQVVQLFGVTPDIDLDMMRPNQSLVALMGRILIAIDEVLDAVRPDVVVVQGDTTTVLTVALAAFQKGVAIAHVEAGLRTGDLQSPFPEEMNRVVTTRLSSIHFAPTETAQSNLLREGINREAIDITGNTVIDALLMVASQECTSPPAYNRTNRLVLITAHRRENFGEPLKQICYAIRDSAIRNPSVQFLFPVHPNPNVRTVAYSLLGGQHNVILCEPMDYQPFVCAMKDAYIVITDSGGVQEEAPALGKPVLVLREETERPEAVAEGVVRLIGPHREPLTSGIQELLDNPVVYRAMAKGTSPYGDGNSANRIADGIRRRFQSVISGDM